MAIGWYETVAGADEYFTDSIHADKWNAIDVTYKTRLLKTAYRRLKRSRLLSIPSTPTGGQLEALREAQAEMAWYFYEHGEDESKRVGLEAQGVVESSMVEEKYVKGGVASGPIPPHVLDILYEFEKQDEPELEPEVMPFFTTGIYRED